MQRRGVDKLCRNTLKCIMIEAAGLCYDIGSRHSRLGAGRWGSGRGKRARGRTHGACGRGARGARQGLAALALGARHGHWVHGTGTG